MSNVSLIDGHIDEPKVNKQFFCNGKQDFCEVDFLCQDCKYFNGTGGIESEVEGE